MLHQLSTILLYYYSRLMNWTLGLGLGDEGLTPTKDGGTCLRRLSMFRKEVH